MCDLVKVPLLDALYRPVCTLAEYNETGAPGITHVSVIFTLSLRSSAIRNASSTVPIVVRVP